jgi:23S rRNA (uridine2552-2'-O)-methyltransferase
MDAVEGVAVLCGDFREEAVLTALEALVPEHSADLVLSDMAPNLSGIGAADQAASIGLCELALSFAVTRLRPGGAFLVKVFQGSGSEAFVREVRTRFAKVQIRKPAASRARSAEIYVLARDLRVV